MECIVLAQEASTRVDMQWQLEDLGAQWRCWPMDSAEQVLRALRDRWVDLVVMYPGEEAERLLTTLMDRPVLSPPCVMGVGMLAPDGELPPVEVLPQQLCDWRTAGHLPALAQQALPTMTRLSRGMLRAVGMPEHMGAWDFLPEMAALTVVHPPLLTDLQHGLYPLVGRRYGLTAGAVERRLRLCVEHAWSHGNLASLERFFGSSVDPERGKPTNREFLCRVQERLNLASRRLQNAW